MKYFFFLALSLAFLHSSAQKQGPFPSSDSIVVTGLVAKPATLSLSALSNLPDTTFETVKILNHLGEYKFTYQQVKGVALKNILKPNLPADLKSKDMLSLYFVLKAKDGFTTVYSYNELFNAPAGGIFLLTGYNALPLNSIPERPVLLITGDYKSAKLGMRGIVSIDVRMAK